MGKKITFACLIFQLVLIAIQLFIWQHKDLMLCACANAKALNQDQNFKFLLKTWVASTFLMAWTTKLKVLAPIRYLLM